MDGSRSQADPPERSESDLAKAAMKAVGDHLRAERNRIDLSQEKFAEATGLGVNTIGRLEAAQRDMKLSQLVEIADVLGVSPGEFLDAAQAAMIAMLKQDTR